MLGIREEEAVEERMAANIRGNVLHDVHEMLFKQLKADQTWGLDRVYDAVEAGIQKHFPRTAHHRTLLSSNATSYTKWPAIGRSPKGSASPTGDDRDQPWNVHLVEETLETFLQVDGQRVKVKGRADRIEAWQNGWAVVDLKSGGASKKANSACPP